MKYYAVLDTNVVVSAMLKWDSVPGNILELVFQGMVIPILNEGILREYAEVLRRAKFHLTEDIVRAVTDGIRKEAVFVSGESGDFTLPDPKDVVFYAVAMEASKAEDVYLVTGNLRHFPAEPHIVTPRQFLDIILNGIESEEN